jgi:signal peptidase I
VEPGEESKPARARVDVAREVFEWSQMLTGGIVVVVLLFVLVFSLFTVSGPSMLDTLHDGEMLLISRLFYTPRRGDIVMFSKAGLELKDDETGRQTPLVKRIIAIGGDHIKIIHSEGAVYLNGELLPETYIREKMTGGLYPDIIELTVSEGSVFCMGDNRNNSKDSRSLREVGEIDSRFILGRVLFRLTPFSKLGFVT